MVRLSIPTTEEILKEIQSLKMKIRELTREIESIKTSTIEDPFSVERLLKMRGIQVFRKNPIDHLFFPPDLSDSYKNYFYEMMKKYSFRLVLRDMIKYQSQFQVQDLTHYCSFRMAQEYCRRLCDMGMISRIGKGKYRIQNLPIFSFGPTLEWFIAEMFKKEFASPAIYSVSVKNTSAGGDFDVIASWNRRLVYVEVKSSPPKGVEQKEISTFFSRMNDISPEVAILFEDTQLRMKDKLVVLFEEELVKRYGKEAKRLYPVKRLYEELFHIKDHIFIINSKKDVVENFKFCLRHYLQQNIEGQKAIYSKGELCDEE